MTEILASLKEWGKYEQKGSVFYPQPAEATLRRDPATARKSQHRNEPHRNTPLPYRQLNKASESFQQ